MLDIETLHHVSLPVSDITRAKSFYRDVLGLHEIDRPPFDFEGAWYTVGDRDLHLIVGTASTFRTGKGIDSRDIHVALRVRSFRGALEHLADRGYGPDAEDDRFRLRVNRKATAGFPQIYLLDPDGNVIEINAAQLD